MDLNISNDQATAIDQSQGFLPDVGKGSGWKPDTTGDPRDYPLKNLLRAAASPTVLPSKIRFDPEYMSRVRDQGQFGSCTGFAVTAAIEYLRRKDNEVSIGGKPFETIYSPLFNYCRSRIRIGELHLDEGAYTRDAVKDTAQIGIARESDCLYYELDIYAFQEPGELAYESARSWRLGAYYKANNLQDVRAALAAGYPVVFGFLCYSNMATANVWATGLIPSPSGYITGGHAVMACGYDDASRTVRFKNSWGTYWGDEGYGCLPYEFFERGLCSDMWVLTSESPNTSGKLRGEAVAR